MPCYEVRTMSVEFHAKHKGLLQGALRALGLHYTLMNDVVDVVGLGKIDLRKGMAEINQFGQSQLNQLKQQYSREALKRAAKLQGWQFKQQQGQLKGVLRK